VTIGLRVALTKLT